MTDDSPASDVPPVDVGDILETALVGPLVGGVVPLWTDGGRVLWEPDDPDSIRSVLACGQLARTEREPDRYREVAMVSRTSGTVMLLPRMSASAAYGGELTSQARVFAAELKPAERVPEATKDEWFEFARWLTEVHMSAAARSEFIVVELGGWDFRDEPYALAFAATDEDPPTNHIESNPRPDGSALWPPGHDPEGQSISAPIDPDTLASTGMLLADAIRTWTSSPLDVAITFATSGHSPLLPSTE